MFTVRYRNQQGIWAQAPATFETYEEAEAWAFAAAPDGAYLVEKTK